MSPLYEQLKHNAWANRLVTEAFRKQPEVLAAVCYDGETVLSRLQHQLGTERAFLDVMRGRAEHPDPPADPESLIAYGDETGAAMAAIVEPLTDAELERAYFVPWWQTEFPLPVLVTQVIAHSAQHRAELAWELARAGIDTGEIDYIRWVAINRGLAT